MTKLKTIVDWCVNSMATEPEAWRHDGCERLYYVAHRSGITVWMANGHSGLGIYAQDHGWLSAPELGGVTGWSALFGSLIPWRRRLYAAAKKVAGEPVNPKPSAADSILAKIEAAA